MDEIRLHRGLLSSETNAEPMSTTPGKGQGGEWVPIESMLQAEVFAPNGTNDDLSSSCSLTSETSSDGAANIVHAPEDTPDIATTPTSQPDKDDVHYIVDKADRSDTDDDLPSLDELLKGSRSLARHGGQATTNPAHATSADAAGQSRRLLGYEDSRMRPSQPVTGTSVGESQYTIVPALLIVLRKSD